MNLLRFTLQKIAEALLLATVALILLEMVLPGSVLPYLPLPAMWLVLVLSVGFVSLASTKASLVLNLLLFLGASLFSIINLDEGKSMVVLSVFTILPIVLFIYGAAKKHNPLS